MCSLVLDFGWASVKADSKAGCPCPMSQRSVVLVGQGGGIKRKFFEINNDVTIL